MIKIDSEEAKALANVNPLDWAFAVGLQITFEEKGVGLTGKSVLLAVGRLTNIDAPDGMVGSMEVTDRTTTETFQEMLYNWQRAYRNYVNQ